MNKTVKIVDIEGNFQDISTSDLEWRPSAYGIVIKDDNVLLFPQQSGKYELPGGGIEIGETLEEGTIREVKEETGIDVEPFRLLEVKTNFFTINHEEGENYQSILFYYACNYVGGSLSSDGFDEFEKIYGKIAEWFPVSKLDSIQPSSSIDWREIVTKYYENSRD